MNGVTAFSDQAQHCEHCDTDVKVDTVLDNETNKSYFICPNCGEGNRT